MADHKSAKKRILQTEKRRVAHRGARSTMRSTLKSARAEIEAGGASSEKGEVKAALIALARAGQNGLLHKRTANRRISRLMQAVNKSNA